MNDWQKRMISLFDLPFGSKSEPPLPPPIGSVVSAFLKICSKPRNFNDSQINRGVEAQAALVGADCGVELDAEAAVDLDFALVVNPRNAELDDALGLDDALKDLCFLVFRMRLDDRFESAHDLGDGLDELGLIGVLRLNLVDNSLDVTHVTSSGFTCSQPRPL